MRRDSQVVVIAELLVDVVGPFFPLELEHPLPLRRLVPVDGVEVLLVPLERTVGIATAREVVTTPRLDGPCFLRDHVAV